MIKRLLAGSSLFLSLLLHAQVNNNISFQVSMEQPASQTFRVQMDLRQTGGKYIDLKMPVWSPGYYQRLDYANNVLDFTATDVAGRSLKWEKMAGNCWRVTASKGSAIRIKYEVRATRAFVANSFLNEQRGYIIPASMFLYPDAALDQPSTVVIHPYAGWNDIATGLEPIKGKAYSFHAPDYDILFDSPILVGKLDSLPSFRVDGVPHYFVGYQTGDFDKKSFIDDLQKITSTASHVIGDIPFTHYTFIGIGPGQGGIEHLNSTTISFNGSGAQTRESRVRTMQFIAHEYFHHYNVKRIRPFELGPFDYDHGSRTNLLWISEGLSVYYEYLIVKRAGISNEEELLNAFRSNIRAYEGKPGRLYQSLTEASYETWSDGPFGRTGDEVNKTISYYDKGPVVGMLLDFAIRHMTENRHSLDDVMRLMYNRYYKQLKRGFTEAEFQWACEEIAGGSLSELFQYTYTTRELDYPKYLAYAGLVIDTARKAQPGPWIGVDTRWNRDSLFISNVDYGSPAWKAGLRGRQVILEVDGQKAVASTLNTQLASKTQGDLQLKVLQSGEIKSVNITPATKVEATFTIRRMESPDALQSAILKDWLN